MDDSERKIRLLGKGKKKNAEQDQKQCDGFAFDVGVAEVVYPDSEGDDTVAASHQRYNGDMNVGQADGIKIKIVSNNQQNSGENNGPPPLEWPFLSEEPSADQKRRSQNEYQIDRKPELDGSGRNFQRIQEIFVIQGGRGSQKSPEHDQPDSAAAEKGDPFQFAEYGKKIVSSENGEHGNSLNKGGEFAEENKTSQESPERRAGADGRRDGNREFAHCIVNASPTG